MMPVKTRNAGNRRMTTQTKASKSKQPPKFLLNALNDRNNENQDEQSTSYSEVENENYIEISINSSFDASNHTTQLEEISPMIQESDNEEPISSYVDIHRRQPASFDGENDQGEQSSLISQQQENYLLANKDMDLPSEEDQSRILDEPTHTNEQHQNTLFHEQQEHDDAFRMMSNNSIEVQVHSSADSVGSRMIGHSRLANNLLLGDKNQTKAQENEDPEIEGQSDGAKFAIDNTRHYTTYFFVQSEFTDYKEQKMLARIPQFVYG
ncbi:unnamed protein product [Didymodactylos carnosus]|uniref:Uncharacterized protein n=1 Tax=Didymodactylos carnosus TaxID=1234261 RepID=A0A8S2HP94_9BILA|nr:unnamed protein product [Didymodactylos carnosus]CAF3651544.1 unnamed protein product [Didymodactylos carnosus]